MFAVASPAMSCKACGSVSRREFPSEICIHPPHGLNNLDGSSVWAFPLLVVCVHCGFTEFTLKAAEVKSLPENERESPEVEKPGRKRPIQ